MQSLSAKSFAVADVRRYLSKVATGVGLAAMLVITPMTALSANLAQTESVRGTQLEGTLPDAVSFHYLGLEPAERDGEIKLTLEYGPNTGAVNDKVGFYVVSPDGLRSIRDGFRPSAVAMAAGTKASSSDDNKVQAIFKVTGRELYTVIVFSDALAPADYKLTAKNATLVDGSNQTRIPGSSVGQPAPVAAGTAAAAAAQNPTLIAGAAIGARQQVYYSVAANERNGSVTLVLDLLTASVSEEEGRITFFVFNQDGFDQLRSGVRPEKANLAAGTYVAKGADTGKLSATFKIDGGGRYVVMVNNGTDGAATYDLKVKDGTLQQ